MSRLEGEMMCEETYMENPVLQTKVLAEGLKDCGQWIFPDARPTAGSITS